MFKGNFWFSTWIFGSKKFQRDHPYIGQIYQYIVDSLWIMRGEGGDHGKSFFFLGSPLPSKPPFFYQLSPKKIDQQEQKSLIMMTTLLFWCCQKMRSKPVVIVFCHIHMSVRSTSKIKVTLFPGNGRTNQNSIMFAQGYYSSCSYIWIKDTWEGVGPNS